MSHELLNHPDVLKTIRAELLRGGYPKDALDDGAGEVVVKVFEYLKEEGIAVETVDRMQAIVRPKSYQHGVDALRGKIQDRKHLGAQVESAEAEGLAAPSSSMEDRLEAKRALRTIQANQKPQDAAILALDGTPQKTVAASLNLSHDQLRKEKGKILTRYRGLLAAGGFAVFALVLLAAIFRLRMVHDEEAQHPQLPPPPVPTAPPPPPEQVPVAVQKGPTPEAKQKAAELRAAAHALAIAKKKPNQWKDCTEAYKAADELDPGGNTPEQDAESGLCADRYLATLNAKP